MAETESKGPLAGYKLIRKWKRNEGEFPPHVSQLTKAIVLLDPEGNILEDYKGRFINGDPVYGMEILLQKLGGEYIEEELPSSKAAA